MCLEPSSIITITSRVSSLVKAFRARYLKHPSDFGSYPFLKTSCFDHQLLFLLLSFPPLIYVSHRDDTLFEFVATVVFKESPSANAIETLPSMYVLVGSILGDYIPLCETSWVTVYPCVKRPGRLYILV